MALEKFFSPSSVAIVGASRKKGKVGYEILKSMIDAGYEGSIFPVNPNTETIEGRKCYPDLKSIGQAPELVIISVPAKTVPTVMQQCAKIGTKSVITITSGLPYPNCQKTWRKAVLCEGITKQQGDAGNLP